MRDARLNARASHLYPHLASSSPFKLGWCTHFYYKMSTAFAVVQPLSQSNNSSVVSRRRTRVPLCSAARDDQKQQQAALSRRSALQLAAAAAALTALPSAGIASPSASHAPPSQADIEYVFDGKSGSFLPPSEVPSMMRRGAGRRFDKAIVVGETHSDARTHDVQLRIIESAHALDDRRLVLGFEQFYPRHNAALNDFRLGRTSLQTMLERTDWQNTWGFQAALYEPIFQYCQTHAIPMFGLNVPAEVTHFVRDFGLAELPEPVRDAFVPDGMDLNNAAHFERFRQRMTAVGHFKHSTAADDAAVADVIARYYQVQVLWEEYMSYSASTILAAAPDTRLVTLIGSGHVEARLGFPDRLEKRINERPFTVVPKPVSWSTDDGYTTPDIAGPEPDLADLVWYCRKQT